MPGLSALNRGFNQIPKRAESRAAEQLRDTFVDSGIAAALEAIDHQVLYGRRGTGKTHAFRYLQDVVDGTGDIAVYLDLRLIGSPEGIFAGDEITPTQRTARLLVDLLANVHDAILGKALSDDGLIADMSFVSALDALLESISTVTVVGEVERTALTEDSAGRTSSLGLSLGTGGPLSLGVQANSSTAEETRTSQSERRSGREVINLNFSDVARALRRLADSLSARRVWILLDEWSSLPVDIQPMLGAFLVRCLLPLSSFSVKIAAIEQQTRFREQRADGSFIGIELGADVAANLDLDEFMVFEQNDDRAREFFRGLLYKHLSAGLDEKDRVSELKREHDLVRLAFTDVRAFDELVRAAEGVPRDAINIVAKAAVRAAEKLISVPDVRAAARTWYQADKEAALRGRTDALELLSWIIDKVIKEKRARAFLVNQRETEAPILLSLFDSRVLHLARRGYSAQDQPGERYDVYVIDYGAYVDLVHTKYEPLGQLPGESSDVYFDVPPQDLRAIRRAILDLSEFERRSEIQ